MFSCSFKNGARCTFLADVPSIFCDFLRLNEGGQSYSNLFLIEVLGHVIPYTTHAMLDDDRVFYNFGLYKLMLMAVKVNKANDVVSDVCNDQESLEILDFYQHMNSVDNPWSGIDRESFLGYRLAKLFKEDACLKQNALSVVDVFFKSFGFYLDARDHLGLAEKMRDLPGEEQMLAYCFCQSLRKVYAACISAEALAGVLELDKDELEAVDILSLKSIFKEKFSEIQEGGVSYQSVWQNIKQKLGITEGNDFVTFDGHGAVLSFDTRALKAQVFEDRYIAEELGFAVVDSSYAPSLVPFYKLAN